jgi:hypothetical protein
VGFNLGYFLQTHLVTLARRGKKFKIFGFEDQVSSIFCPQRNNVKPQNKKPAPHYLSGRKSGQGADFMTDSVLVVIYGKAESGQTTSLYNCDFLQMVSAIKKLEFVGQVSV